MLADWDGRLTIPTLNLVSRHIEQCEACTQRRRGTLRPEALARLLPRPALPPGLREQVLEFCPPDEVIADRRPLTQGAPSPLVAKSPRAAEWASLARLEIDLIFTAIADAMPGIALAGKPSRLRSGWLNGIKHLPVSYR